MYGLSCRFACFRLIGYDRTFCGRGVLMREHCENDTKVRESGIDQASPASVSVAMTEVLQQAELIYSAADVQSAISQMAEKMTTCLRDQNPLVLCVMNGGAFLTQQLTLQLKFPLEMDYLHASRYRGQTRGGTLDWLAKPKASLEGRVVLLVDDILDEGYTLVAVREYLQSCELSALYTAVLVNKKHARKAEPDWLPDFVGLEVEDRYVFGCGMDYKKHWRHLPEIYAVKE